jgi:hypothetical protein
MHGEYKTPGGKLVAVDFEVRAGQLAGVMVTGDFFLYPEESLEAIAAALEGLPATAGEGEIARAVEANVPPGTEMLGFSPDAVAIAVRRGLAVP